MFRFLRTGKVSSVNYKEASISVEFDDSPGVISEGLKVLFEHTSKEKDYSMPNAGEDVVCLFLPNDSHAPSVGFVLGSYYSGKNLPSDTGKIKYIFFPDGTKVKYDFETHLLEIDCVGDIEITSAKNVTISASNIDLQANTISMTANTLNIDAVTDVKQAMTTKDVDVAKLTTPKGDVDLHKHNDAENRPTTIPL